MSRARWFSAKPSKDGTGRVIITTYPDAERYISVEDAIALRDELLSICAPRHLTVRDACRARHPLDRADAEALEHAVTITEQERDQARRERDEARAEVARLMLKVPRLPPPEPAPVQPAKQLCPYPHLHAADCTCGGSGGAR